MIRPRAWLATATIDRDGRRCDIPEGGALTIVAVSVHEQHSVKVDARIELMHAVARRQFQQIPCNIPSLWVFPAGYFGFDAAKWSIGNKNNAWWNWDPNTLEQDLSKIVEPYPIGAWVAFGVDFLENDGDCIQEVWLVRRISSNAGSKLDPRKITRKSSQKIQYVDESSHKDRCVDLDDQGFKAAFFVCDDIAGYRGELSNCQLVVDLAHVRVPGTVWTDMEGARMAHQKALRAAGIHGAALLAHHHTGQTTTAGGTHFRHQSNWVMFRGNEPEWLLSSEVEEVP